MYPKVTLEFESNTLALNEYIDGPYHIQTTATVSGTIDMVNTHSVNPMVVDQEGLKAQAKAAANQLFAELKVERVEGNLAGGASMSLGFENQNYQITLTSQPQGFIPNTYVLTGSLTKKLSEIKENNWKLSGSVTIEITMTAIKKKNNSGSLSSDISKDWQETKDYVNQHWKEISITLLRYSGRIVTASSETAEGAEMVISTNPELIALVFV